MFTMIDNEGYIARQRGIKVPSLSLILPLASVVHLGLRKSVIHWDRSGFYITIFIEACSRPLLPDYIPLLGDSIHTGSLDYI